MRHAIRRHSAAQKNANFRDHFYTKNDSLVVGKEVSRSSSARISDYAVAGNTPEAGLLGRR